MTESIVLPARQDARSDIPAPLLHSRVEEG